MPEMKQFTHRYINQVTGAFVLLALLISVSVIYVAGQEHSWFKRTIAFGLLLPEEGSYGLKPGAAVMILGAVAGEITDITITSDDRMMARMRVRQDFVRFIGTDSHATIKKTMGVAGDSFVNISGRPGPPLNNDTLIEAVVDREVMEMLEETLEKVRAELLPALRSIRLAAESHVQLTENLQIPALKTIETLNSIATKIDKGQGLANRVLSDELMADDVRAVIDQTNIMVRETSAAAMEFQTTVAQIGRSARTLQDSIEQLPETIHRTNTTVLNVNSQVTSLSGVIVQAQATLREIQRLAEAMQQHWLLRDYVEDDAPNARIRPREVIITP